MTGADGSGATVVSGSVHAVLSWSYEPLDSRLGALYLKAKHGQWDGDTDIDWALAVPTSAEEMVAANEQCRTAPPAFPLPNRQFANFQWEYHVWLVSQFLHGEQGALLSAGRLIEVLPAVDGKLLAATQAVDEARHVEVYARYINEKLLSSYAANPSLEELLRQILQDSRWDLVCLGMQIIIEGLALAAFRLSSRTFADPLITSITERISRDEARHVSFGMLALADVYGQLTTAERRDREDFVLEAAQLMSRRFQLPEVWEKLGVRAADGRAFVDANPEMTIFRQILFSRVNASIARLGLMTDDVKTGLTQLRLYRPVFGATREP